MIVLHGGYLPASPEGPSGFYVFGEGRFRERVERDRHPRGVAHGDLEDALRHAAAPGFSTSPARVRREELVLLWPVLGPRPVPSVPAIRDSADYQTGELFTLKPLRVDALVLPAATALHALLDLPEVLRVSERAIHVSDGLDYWSEAARWAFDLLRRRRVAPTVDGEALVWHPVLTDPHDKERLARFASGMPPVSRTVSRAGAPPRDAALSADGLLRAFLHDVTDSVSRELVRSILPAERRRGVSTEAALVATLALAGSAEPPPHAQPSFLRRLHQWTQPLLEPLPEGDLRLSVRLLPPEPGEGVWRLTYHLASTEDPSLRLSAADVWDSALAKGRRFQNPEESLLSRLGQAAPLSKPIARSLDERHPTGAELTPDEAHDFLTRDAQLLSEAGVQVNLPSDGKLARIGVRLTAKESEHRPASVVTRFGLSTLVDFDWKVAVGDLLLSPEEFEELAARKIPLVDVRGEWVLLDPESVARTLALFDRRPGGRTTLVDLLQLAGGAVSEDIPIDALAGEGWLQELLDPASVREEVRAFTAPKELTGTLRPYQERGTAWLRFLLSRGLGACLADDMGLGKTIQLLAALLSAREAGEAIRPSLIVCPTSVAENWLREAARFAPTLSVAIHHGPERTSGAAFQELLAKTDILVTTYPLVHRDRALLSEVVWEVVALDEAQNVKNPNAAQSRAVRGLRARRRAALTGTPMENRLAELKSIFDFLAPSLLGGDEAFRKSFSIPIERERDAGAAERLRRVTAPFLLRRTKTDPTIAPDLPEKIETKEYVGLTREQATLYRATTRAILQGIGRSRGQSRRAKVLTLLLRLKQICNHPAHFLGDGSRLEGRSGKVNRLLAILEETLAEGRPALLFTQFTEMGHLLVTALRDRFAAEVLFLHGGVPRKARHEMVRRFQEDADPPPFFVLSLRAGGSGLNLTRASHVLHVDRWWNPAVEDQATDRAFRLGQKRNVQVHKFVCKGTLEERIDIMLDEKKELAQRIIGAGEGWIAALPDDELAELVALSPSALEASS